MIQPKNVHLSQQGAQAVDAPTIAGSANSVPVVDGVAPKLSLRAEIIGRDSGDEPAPALFVQQKQLRGFTHTSLESGETKKGKSPIKRTPLAWA
jgi:hypothetical protein